MKSGINEIIAERSKQLDILGYSIHHDVTRNTNNELISAIMTVISET